MQITKQQLQQLINEELDKAFRRRGLRLNETLDQGPKDHMVPPGESEEPCELCFSTGACDPGCPSQDPEYQDYLSRGEPCSKCGSENTEQLSAPSMYHGEDSGVKCLDCGKVTWAVGGYM